MIPHIYNGNGTISLMLDGVMKPVDTAHRFYEEIKQALKEQKWDLIPSLVNIKDQVEKAINASTAKGQVTIRDGEVFYNGTRVHNTLTGRIVSMAKEGFDIAHMVKFLENLMANPSYRAVNELYDFLEAGQIPITENGTFLTYKKIRSNWKDIHSGNFDNSIGTKVTMARNMVDEDSSRTCSAGLHVCSYGYLPHFGCSGGDRVVICEVNPADVVSIPTDYNNTKMRVCAYTVIGEVENYADADILANKTVVNTRSVRGGAVAGTSLDSAAKTIGKKVTTILDDGFLDGRDAVEAICLEAGLDQFSASEIQEIVDDSEYKRAGKKVSFYISEGKLDSVKFLKALEDALGASEEGRECGRCGATLEEDEDECPQCGFWN
jgi:hypothetical protein